MENRGQGGSLNHLGVEVANTDAVDTEQQRLAQAGLASIDVSSRPARRPASSTDRTPARAAATRSRSTG
jgi:hypothetical protein